MILMNDFKAEPLELKKSMKTATDRVIESGWYVLGKEVEQLEKSWSSICGSSYSIGVGNGMDAIEIILRALDIGPGDEVITTPMTAFATVLAILRAGATPVLADINPNTALLSLNSVHRCITIKTKAILLVHLYGQMRDMDLWESLCNDQEIALIEDCAQSHLAKWNEKVAGTYGIAGAYSFYPTKNLGALGDAGLLITNDNNLSEKAKKIRNYGQSERYHHPLIGMNSRLDEIHAAILTERLKYLEEFTKRRRQIASMYWNGLLSKSIKVLSAPQSPENHVHHLYAITCDDRDSLQAYLHNHGVQSLIHYPIPIHHQLPCSDICYDSKGLSESEKYSNTCLSLPCHPHLTDSDVQIVIDSVNNYQNR